ncbi:MAG: hypothetical protein ACM3NQ_07480 [Bacteroidales bacterium]
MNAETVVQTGSPSYQAYQILHVILTIAPIAAGADKFLHLLVDWDKYASPLAAQVLPVPIHTFMLAVGVIEIAAGVLVAIAPRIGAWVVAAWLWAIILNLLSIPGYFDIALRDFGLSMGAVALARLSSEYDRA